MHGLVIGLKMADIEELIRQNQQQAERIESLIGQNQQLSDRLDKQANTIARLSEENQQLKDEIAVLKGTTPRPKIPPSILEGNQSKDKKNKKKVGRGKHPRKNKTKLTIHTEVVIAPASIPDGAVFKGFKSYTVQNIILQQHNTRYKLARWMLPDGSYITGELPKGVCGHYGADLVTYALHQHYACNVTQPLLLQQLHTRGTLISAGQLNNILIENKLAFHEEKSELLMAGVQAHAQIQVDDTGGRHRGKNQHTTVIGNEWFSVFTTTDSKSRVNFFLLLQNGVCDYLINDDTIAYLKGSDAPAYLAGLLSFSNGTAITGESSWIDFLRSKNITKTNEIRFVTEAALLASVIDKGIPRDLGVHSDDAGQFDSFIHSLCWVHEERLYRKIIPTTDQARADLEQLRDQIWELYRKLKNYKSAPDTALIQPLSKQFDTLFSQTTSSPTLNKRLALTLQKKEKLLRVLKRPDTPLHNNSSETDARSAVTKRKVSSGTRSDLGRAARDTMLSLKQTCRKLGQNFFKYLLDRVSGQLKIPRLSELIRQMSEAARLPT